MAKEMIAMILAGGRGSRLYALTQKLAKPAKYRSAVNIYHRFPAVQLR